jgi:hypothetical protein
MSRLIFASLLSLFFVSIGFNAHSLDQKSVENFIDSFVDIRDQTETFDQYLPDIDNTDIELSADYFQALLLRFTEDYPNAEKIIKDNDFSSSLEWSQTGSEVFLAYFAMIANDAYASLDQDIQQVENQHNITPDTATSITNSMIYWYIDLRNKLAFVSEEEIDMIRPYAVNLQDNL